ncbi:MAG: DinB family protein [Ignavibacteriales bacterium]|nr:DinB family protein [Ignavibacteriales bacterium]
MPKFISPLMFAALAALLFTFTSAQEKKSPEPPKPAQNPSQELLWMWNGVGNKLIAMAEDFPEDKYGFKAQKDQRTFGDNLLHVAADYYYMINAIKGSAVGYTGNDDSLRKKFPSKTDIVKYLKQAVTDGAQLIKEQGDSGLTREFKFPWGNFMAHGAFGWNGSLEHAGEHYGQLVVYYRVNGIIPPDSRPKK